MSNALIPVTKGSRFLDEINRLQQATKTEKYIVEEPQPSQVFNTEVSGNRYRQKLWINKVRERNCYPGR